MIHTIAQQVNDMVENFVKFSEYQSELRSSLQSVIENQNKIRQEIFLLKNENYKDTRKSSPEPSIVHKRKTVDAATQTLALSPDTVSNPKILHMSDARNLIDNEEVEIATGANIVFDKISKTKAGKCSEFLPEMVCNNVEINDPDCLVVQTGGWLVEKGDTN